MSDWTDEFLDIATQASTAFEELRDQLRSAADQQATPPDGALVGERYRVVRELGKGGFGTVFEVEHDLLGHRFAMKLLNPRIASDPAWIARFREEARATSLIGHENIVFVTDFGEDETWGYYFVMEYLEGSPLDAVLQREGAQKPERMLRFVHAAASAFGAVHELGIIHCDLKPSNVFMVERPRQSALWKILDFGTSTVVMQAVATQALFGTPKYMAPEQSIGHELTPRSDQFALGCIVYEMATGQLPWDIRNWIQAMPEVRAQNPPRKPSELSETCPPAWDEPILKAIAIDPADRWPSIDTFARALDQAFEMTWRPTVDPLDVRRDDANPGFGRTRTAPSVAILPPRESPSVVIDVETGEESDDRALVRVVFHTRNRFMREVRRNLNVGGLFVPSEELLPLRSSVNVRLEYKPHDLHKMLQATVVGHETRRDTGRGFGLAFEPRQHSELTSFIEQIGGPSLRADDELTAIPNSSASSSLSPGEWFVLSRIEGGITLARLRSMCAGLPFDLDDVVSTLVKRQLVRVKRATSSRPATPSKPAIAPVWRPSNEPRVEPRDEPRRSAAMDVDDVESVLERVDFHRHQHNYLGATDLLKRAISVSPGVAAFHYRLALLRMEFDNDPLSASSAARKAVEIEPDNEVYASLLESLRKRR